MLPLEDSTLEVAAVVGVVVAEHWQEVLDAAATPTR
jgi:hypothetical protein